MKPAPSRPRSSLPATWSSRKKSIAKLKAAEGVAIPEWIDYDVISGLSREMRETLKRVRPATIGQASRLPGVTPAALEPGTRLNPAARSQADAILRPSRMPSPQCR
jgi:hypothetical protein